MSDKLTETDIGNIKDVIWYMKGQIDAHKLNDDWRIRFSNDHVDSLRKSINQKAGINPLIQTLPNHWITEPIRDLRQLRFEAEAKRSVWHKHYGIRPAAVIINMTGHVLSTMFQGDNLYKLIKK